jgi:hypothetical protein
VAAQVDDLEAAIRVAAQLRVMPGDLEVSGEMVANAAACAGTKTWPS